MSARIKETYLKQVAPRLLKERNYPNVMAIPRLQKVVVNMGVGEATQNIKLLDVAMDELGRITGQKPAMRRSRKSIAAFKLREKMPIAATVTLRGDRMYEFLDRLFNVALPRVRDFRGVPTGSFDGRGNYTLGLRDQLIFPEIDYSKVDKTRGMNVTFVTSARTDEESRLLLQYLGMPFRTQTQEAPECRRRPCLPSRRRPPSSRCASTTAAATAAGRAATCGSSRCAASASASCRWPGIFPA